MAGSKKISEKLLPIVAVLLVTGAAQAAFFLRGGGSIALFVGIMLLLFSWFKGIIKFKFKYSDLFFLLLLSAMFVLGCLLLLFGSPGEFQERNIAFYSLVQVLLVLGLIGLFQERLGQSYVLIIFLTLIFVETVIIMGQFSFVAFEIGFSNLGEFEGDKGVLSGSLGNPNNSAAFIGLMALALTSRLVAVGYKKYSYLLLFSILPAIFLTLSRTVLVFWFLNFLAVMLSAKKKSNETNGYIFIFISTIAIAVTFFYVLFSESEVIVRALIRIGSIGQLNTDESMDFRFVSHLRLVEGISTLGLGTYSDLNYYQFFKAADPWLMKVNPHSYLTEYSFLFGYAGLFVIFAIHVFLVISIMANPEISIPLRVVACVGVFFIQAVPSSLLTSYYFFLPFIFMWKMTASKQIDTTRLPIKKVNCRFVRRG